MCGKAKEIPETTLDRAIRRLAEQMAATDSMQMQIAWLTVGLTNCLDIISEELKNRPDYNDQTAIYVDAPNKKEQENG